jgi:hypothetical protein
MSERSDPTAGAKSDILLAFYKEHVEMARQHETQRSTLTSIILTISGVLIGFAAYPYPDSAGSLNVLVEGARLGVA